MDTKSIIEKYNIRANKNFGQNFLHRQDILELIADSASGTPCCLEIGIGLGFLTRELCQRFQSVITVEIDKSLDAPVRDVLSDVTNHELVYGNFLKTDIGQIKRQLGDRKLTVCGNLPYNITGEIISKLMKNCGYIEKAVVMVQKEAAEKLAASPSDEGYRAVSVLTQYFFDIETVCDVSPDCFIPAPHVTSRVIRLEKRKDRKLPAECEADFYAFVHSVFSKRRKLLTASMQGAEQKQKALDALSTLGLSDKTRAEQMSPEQISEFYKLMFCE